MRCEVLCVISFLARLEFIYVCLVLSLKTLSVCVCVSQIVSKESKHKLQKRMKRPERVNEQKNNNIDVVRELLTVVVCIHLSYVYVYCLMRCVFWLVSSRFLSHILIVYACSFTQTHTHYTYHIHVSSCRLYG